MSNPNSLPDWDNNTSSDPTKGNISYGQSSGNGGNQWNQSQQSPSQYQQYQYQPQPQQSTGFNAANQGNYGYGGNQQPYPSYEQGTYGGGGFNQTHQTQESLNQNQVRTTLGVVEKVGLSDPVPTGWRVLTINEGRQVKQELMALMNEWSIVAFDRGKLEGPGYGSGIQQDYGSECGQRFIIRKQ